jgi:hypothetical protein
MRAIAPILSLACAFGCGRVEPVELTAKLVMSRFPNDWCEQRNMNPDNIRMDCPFDLGLYVVDEASQRVLKTTCVKLEGDLGRRWGNLTETLNANGVRLELTPEGPEPVRLEMAVVEPAQGDCGYEAAMAGASFWGRSEPVTLMGAEVGPRIDVATRCLKSFTPTATCLP